jgi:hypothetical protein
MRIGAPTAIDIERQYRSAQVRGRYYGEKDILMTMERALNVSI